MRKSVFFIVFLLAVGAFLFQGAAEVSAKKGIKMRSEILSIPASAFSPIEEIMPYHNNGLVLISLDEEGIFVAPLLLPDGARIGRGF